MKKPRKQDHSLLLNTIKKHDAISRFCMSLDNSLMDLQDEGFEDWEITIIADLWAENLGEHLKTDFSSLKKSAEIASFSLKRIFKWRRI